MNNKRLIENIAQEVCEILLNSDRFKIGNSFLRTIDEHGDSGNICISQVVCINETPELLPKVGSEHSLPELALDIIRDTDVFCVTAKLVDGTDIRLYQTGLQRDADTYISEIIMNRTSDSIYYLGTPMQKVFGDIQHAIEKIEVKEPDGATFDDIHVYLRDRLGQNIVRSHLMHIIREMLINSTYSHDIPRPYQSGNLYDIDTNRFRYKTDF